MARPKKEGRRDVFHLGNWALTKLRQDASRLNMSLGDVATEALETYYATLDMRHIDLNEIEPSSPVCLRLSPDARKMLDEISLVTGVRPSSALNVILLWAYLTHDQSSSITD